MSIYRLKNYLYASLMDLLSVPSALIVPSSDKALTPAMVTALWVIGDGLDKNKISADTKEPVWLSIPSRRLRGGNGRNDNVWLRQCLERLTGIKIAGEYRGDPWGAVMIAEWHLEQGGAITRLLIPPAAIQAIRGPETFAKIEAFAAYKLQGGARRLYVALADKKRQTQPYWTFRLDELRNILGVSEKKSYQRWNNFRQWVLAPAIEQINDFGTVTIKMTPEKIGRSVAAVRFDWEWKSIDQIRETSEENEKPNIARRKNATVRDAPPLMNETHSLEEQLRLIIPPEKWESWFKECTFKDTSESIQIIAPSPFIQQYIKGNFGIDIRNAKEALNINKDIDITKS